MGAASGIASGMEPIRISRDGRSFAFPCSERRFVPSGFNYDRDAQGRLLEDYWVDEWLELFQKRARTIRP